MTLEDAKNFLGILALIFGWLAFFGCIIGFLVLTMWGYDWDWKCLVTNCVRIKS